MAAAPPVASLQLWRDSAHAWRKHRALVRRLFQPISQALIEAGRVRPGEVVLDVAAGAGEPSLEVAGCCAPSGRVVCTDAVFEMVASARADARAGTVANVRFAQCSGEALPFRSQSFDVVFCRFGIMLFDDPAAALREMLRVLAPGGRLAVSVWHRSDKNPFFSVVMPAIARYAETPWGTDPDAPGAFRFAEPGKLAALAQRAGFAAVGERRLACRMEAPVGLDDFWTIRSELSETIRRCIAPLSEAQLAELTAEVREAARPYFATGSMSFPAEALIIHGEKP